MTLTRHSLIKCRTKDCPFTPDEHDEWMDLCSRAPEHGHRHDQPTHQHHPKKGMGGNNPLSKIVAVLCWPFHDRIDNGEWGNAAKDVPGRGLVYWAWDIHGNTLIEKDLDSVLSAAAESERSRAQAGSEVSATMGVAFDSSVPPVSTKGSAAAPSAGVLSDGAEEGIPSTQAGTEVRPSTTPASAPSLSTKEESDGTVRHGLDTHVPGSRGDAASGDVGEPTETGSPNKPVAASRDNPPNDSQHRPVHHSSPLTHEQRVAIAQDIARSKRDHPWRAGDQANEWVAELGESAWQYIETCPYELVDRPCPPDPHNHTALGYTILALSNAMRVCERIPAASRNGRLTHSHHTVVYNLNREDMEMWLDKCEEEQWSVAEFRRQVKGTKPRVKRWSLEELRELASRWWAEASEGGLAQSEMDGTAFLDWLEEQA